MKSLASWLFTIFAIMFWGYRVILAITESLGIDMGVTIPNTAIEIVLLFTTLACMILIIKRMRLGGLIYFVSYLIYFGQDIYAYGMKLIAGEALEQDELGRIFMATLGITISFLVLADLVLNKHRANKLGDKKTDWFFKGEQYDRQFDERADRNEYKTR